MTPSSWADRVPVRTVAWSEEEGAVSLLIPRFGRGRFAALLERRLRTRPYRVRLDEIGSFIWMCCDGRTRVDEIGAALRRRFGERIEPVEGRLVRFLQSLTRGRFVRLERPGAGS